MVNQSSNVATDAFGDTIFLCIGRCGGWTTSVDEVCECCEERGLSRDLILMEDEFLDSLEAEEDYHDSMDEFEDFDDDYGFDYDFNMESEGRDWD